MSIVSDTPLTPDEAICTWSVTRVQEGASRLSGEDHLAVEEPLEIRVAWQQNGSWQEEPLTITMRTPGHDLELAAGLLFSEGIIRTRAQLAALTPGEQANVVVATLAADHQWDAKRFQRHFYSTSSCGVCGKMAIESLSLLHEPTLQPTWPVLPRAVLSSLPSCLRDGQTVFGQTGGVHAAALFTTAGDCLLLREDIGRHNAVDKLLGARLLQAQPHLNDAVLVVSGRISFELVQKALAANIAIMVAVGAASSLAVTLAQKHGMTLAGFVRAGAFTLYTAPDRIV